MVDFNPFGKSISKVRKADLDKLIKNQIAEGWFVEYKQDWVAAKKIGHSIASFANSDGGWYIIGIRANDENIAEEIVGIDLSATRNPTDKIRNIIKDHISPFPYFESRLIKLNSERGVIIVRIERGDETPYITTDGRIYRRVGEGSDPIPETDRYSIQKLFERSLALSEKIKLFRSNPFTMSQAQEKQSCGFLEVYIHTTPFDSFHINDFYTEKIHSQIKSIYYNQVQFIGPTKASINFNSIYSSAGSYILRHVPNSSELANLGLTAEIFENGNIKLIIPLSRVSSRPDYDEPPPIYKGSTNYKEITKLLDEEEGYLITLLDGYNLFCSFLILYNQYSHLLRENHYRRDVLVHFKLTDIWRTCLYFDDKSYIENIKTNGLPVCLKDNIVFPDDSIGFPAKLKDGEAMRLFGYLLEGLGHPISLIKTISEGFGGYVAQLAFPNAQ